MALSGVDVSVNLWTLSRTMVGRLMWPVFFLCPCGCPSAFTLAMKQARTQRVSARRSDYLQYLPNLALSRPKPNMYKRMCMRINI
jgi:hypothetical protein